MHKTTIYLPEPLRARVKRVATDRGVSEADVIRAAVEQYTAEKARPRPKLPLFDSGVGGLAENVDDALRGFGEH